MKLAKFFALIIKLFFFILFLGIIAITVVWFSPQIPFLKDKIPPSLRDTTIKTITELLPDTHEYYYPSWDVTGDNIVLVIGAISKKKTPVHDLFTYNTSSRSLLQLTHQKWTDPILYPVFAPKGHTIIFTVVKGMTETAATNNNANGIGEIYLVDDKGFKTEKISENDISSFTSYSSGIWSLDGQKLLYYTIQNTGKTDIAILDIGTRERKIIPTKGAALFASWSPDRTLMTWQERTQDGYQVMAGKNDGSLPKQITKNGDFRYPIWSPDGSRILFMVYRDDKPATLGSVSLSGEQFQIFSGIPPDPKHPSWSYDSRHILFEAKDHKGGLFQIFAVDVEGTHIRTLTKGSEHRYPVWRPQDRTLLCVGIQSRLNIPKLLSGDISTPSTGLFLLDKDSVLRGHNEDEEKRVPIPIKPQ